MQPPFLLFRSIVLEFHGENNACWRMELQALDHQLKGAIQSHQMLVSKMKNDPQNGSLQKQLHELQSQIRALSERQKQVVQQLRMDLEIKQQHTSVVRSDASLSSLPHHSPPIIRSLPQTIPLSLTTKQVDLRPKGITVSASILLPSKVHISTSLTNSNCCEPSRTPLAPVGASMSVNSNNAAITLNLADSTCESTTLTSPIRVPQYPPPHSRPNSLLHFNHQKPAPSYLSNSKTIPLALSSNYVVDGTKSPVQLPQVPSPHPASAERASPTELTLPNSLDDASLKTTFMTAIGLITHEMLLELQNRRSERKRRTTANPQFSYGNWEHHDKKCSRSNYLTDTLPCGFKRPRGRPRLGSTTSNGSRPTSPEDCLENGNVVGLPSIHVLQNGIVAPENKVCIICQENGDLLNCEVCLLSYHHNCLGAVTSIKEEEPNITRWICPKCLNGDLKGQHLPRSLAIVHGYIIRKSAKEEEKRKLLKRGIELKAERNHLERKAKQLTEALSVQAEKRSNLITNTKDVLDSIEQLKFLCTSLKTS